MAPPPPGAQGGGGGWVQFSRTHCFGDAAPSLDNSPGATSGDLYVILLFQGGERAKRAEENFLRFCEFAVRKITS